MDVPGQLHELDERAVRRRPGDHQTGVLELRPVGVVHLVAVTVALRDQLRAVGHGGDRPRGESCVVRAETHGAAHVTLAADELDLLRHRGNQRVRRVGVELRRRRVRDADDVAGVLDHHRLESEADAQRRHLVLARPAKRAELPLDTSDAEAAGDEDRVHAAESVVRSLRGLAVVRGHPADRDLGVVVEPAGAERLGHRQVRVGQVDVLADEGDLDLVRRAVHALEQLRPAVPVDVSVREPEPTDDVGVEPFAVQDRGMS